MPTTRLAAVIASAAAEHFRVEPDRAMATPFPTST